MFQFYNFPLEFHDGMDGPTLAAEVAGITAAVVGRVAHKVGVVVECTLIDGEEFMSLDPAVVRALQFRIAADL